METVQIILRLYLPSEKFFIIFYHARETLKIRYVSFDPYAKCPDGLSAFYGTEGT